MKKYTVHYYWENSCWCSRTFGNEEKANKYAEDLGETKHKIDITELDSYFTYSNNAYGALEYEDFYCLGTLKTCRGEVSGTAYFPRGNEEAYKKAKASFDKKSQENKDSQDRYYSQIWV